LIQPSAKSKKKITQKLSQTIKLYRQAEQGLLIVKLNEITRGWAEYHHCVCAKSTFDLMDHRIWEMLWKWAKRRHPKKSNKWIKARYWHVKGNRQWIFRTEKVILYQMTDMPIVRIKSLNRNVNPFIDPQYFRRRRGEHKGKRALQYANSAAAYGGYYTL
jgi:RNA-directed DNA polymerase